MPSDYSYLHVTIPTEILQQFRDVMLAKHARHPYGAISREIARLMQVGIAHELKQAKTKELEAAAKQQQQDDWKVKTLKSRPITRIDRKYRMVVAYLEQENKPPITLRADEDGFAHCAVIPEKIWRSAIQYVVGLDERTIERWTSLFINLKFVAFCPSAALGLPNKYMISAAEYHLTEADLEQHKDHGKWLIEVSSVRR